MSYNNKFWFSLLLVCLFQCFQFGHLAKLWNHMKVLLPSNLKLVQFNYKNNSVYEISSYIRTILNYLKKVKEHILHIGKKFYKMLIEIQWLNTWTKLNRPIIIMYSQKNDKSLFSTIKKISLCCSSGSSREISRTLAVSRFLLKPSN